MKISGPLIAEREEIFAKVLNRLETSVLRSSHMDETPQSSIYALSVIMLRRCWNMGNLSGLMFYHVFMCQLSSTAA